MYVEPWMFFLLLGFSAYTSGSPRPSPLLIAPRSVKDGSATAKPAPPAKPLAKPGAVRSLARIRCCTGHCSGSVRL